MSNSKRIRKLILYQCFHREKKAYQTIWNFSKILKHTKTLKEKQTTQIRKNFSIKNMQTNK